MGVFIATLTELVAEFIVNFVSRWLIEALIGAFFAVVTETAVAFVTEWLVESMTELVTQLVVWVKSTLATA